MRVIVLQMWSLGRWFPNLNHDQGKTPQKVHFLQFHSKIPESVDFYSYKYTHKMIFSAQGEVITDMLDEISSLRLTVVVAQKRID